MSRFLLTLAVAILVVWTLRRLFAPPRKPPPAKRRDDVIEGSYSVVDKDADKDRAQ